MKLNRLINISWGLFLGAALAGCGGGEPEFSSVEEVEASSQERDQAVTQLRITSDPVDQSAQVGQTATFRVGVNLAASALSYQWFRNGVAIDGAIDSSYTTPELTIADSDSKYSVTVKNGSQSVSSKQAVLKVGVVPPTPMLVISIQPGDQSVDAGQAATFSVLANASPGAITYQWFKNGTAITGATASTYTTPATVQADDGATYSVIVKSNVLSQTSAGAVLKVNTLDITTSPKDQLIDAGQAASFSVAASAKYSTVTYQWFKNGTEITGATNSSYTTPVAVPADDGDRYLVRVKSGALSQTSAEAALKVNTLGITTQPNDQSVDLGTPASFSVAASATYSPVTYQWFRNGTAILGATKSTYTTPDTTLAVNSAKYTVTVRSGTLSKTSRDTALTATGKLPHSDANICYSDVVWTWNCSDPTVLALNGQQDGHRLSVNPLSYSQVADSTTGQTYSLEECVKDNVTGLIWEGKTGSGDRAGSNSYTNYDSGSGVNAPSNSRGYVNLVNGKKLCGYNDWRLPSIEELHGIFSFNNRMPSILLPWFPNTGLSPNSVSRYGYWSSSVAIGVSTSAWVAEFFEGEINTQNQATQYFVRLVRGNQP